MRVSFRNFYIQTHIFTFRMQGQNTGSAVDMTVTMTTELGLHAKRPLKVNRILLLNIAQIGDAQCLLEDIEIDPTFSKLDDREANAIDRDTVTKSSLLERGIASDTQAPSFGAIFFQEQCPRFFNKSR